MAKHSEEKNKTSDQAEDSAIRINAWDAKLVLAKKLISGIREELANLERILDSAEEGELDELDNLFRRRENESGEYLAPSNEGKIIEGVFDGQNMVGSDGRQYIVPPNYASKSKLVEGDILKLTIQPNGSFIYKQIGPIERQRTVANTRFCQRPCRTTKARLAMKPSSLSPKPRRQNGLQLRTSSNTRTEKKRRPTALFSISTFCVSDCKLVAVCHP